MDIFSWLFVGHLLGDWVLQNDWMAVGKKKGLITLPGMTHFAIYTFTVMTFLWLSGYKPQNLLLYIGLAALIFVSHWLIDATGVVESWIRFYRQSDLTMMRVAVDQTFHLIILLLAATLAG